LGREVKEMRLVLGLVALLISCRVYATGANSCDNPGAALNNPHCQEQPPPPPPPPPPEYPPEVPPETNPISELVSKTLEELLQIKVQEKVEEVVVEQPKKLNLVLPVTEMLNIVTATYQQPVQQTAETAAIVRLEPRLELVTQTLSQSSLSVADQEAAGVLPVIKEAPRPVATKTSNAQSDSNSYMEANQGVVLDAMSTTDVSSYRAANIPDLSLWYKSVDVYKNNRLDDNKRSYYFMNKGSSDTFKQMIEDQYR
jgi:hypothetical protein